MSSNHDKSSPPPKLEYEFFSIYYNAWILFIPLKKNDEFGEDIVNFNYEELPQSIYGKILMGNSLNNMPVYMYCNKEKSKIRVKS